jgi:hypothetical protein
MMTHLSRSIAIATHIFLILSVFNTVLALALALVQVGFRNPEIEPALGRSCPLMVGR